MLAVIRPGCQRGRARGLNIRIHLRGEPKKAADDDQKNDAEESDHHQVFDRDSVIEHVKSL
jgi:hypothetical protein